MSIKLPDIHAVKKNLALIPKWIEVENGKLSLFAPLEINGVTIEGLNLRGSTLKDRPDEAVMFQLEYRQHGRRDHAISRVDWRPFQAHNNRGKGPREWRHRIMRSSHHHSFDLNWYAAEGRLLVGNLPVALPINDDPESFQELLAFVRDCFRISDMEMIQIPEWEEGLL